jgi:polysaccharide pyruvyl transferase WcaK-like protein
MKQSVFKSWKRIVFFLIYLGLMGFVIKTTDMTEEEYQRKKQEFIAKYEEICRKNREREKKKREEKKKN